MSDSHVSMEADTHVSMVSDTDVSDALANHSAGSAAPCHCG